ncbi:MAG: methionine synthase [Bacillota bacterium]
MKYDIVKELNAHILILDGAMGTMIQGYSLDENAYRGKLLEDAGRNIKGNNDILSLTQPCIIREIHEKYLEAGSNIIETNTLNSTRLSQTDYGTEAYVYEMNRHSAVIAREAARKYIEMNPDYPRFVAGSIGPTSKSCSLNQDINRPQLRTISFDELVEAYEEQIRGLLDGGVDLLLIETIIDALNARAALYAAESIFKEKSKNLPIIVSATVNDKSGRILSGQTLEAFFHSMKNENVIAMGLNCSFGAKELAPFIKHLTAQLDCFISIYPNAGFRNVLGEFEEKPVATALALKELIDGGYVNIVGGCCGTTPEHIREIAAACRGKAPRRLPAKSHKTILCGLEPLHIDISSNFINVGERTNVTGSRKFRRLIAEKKYDEALSIAREQIENGARIIDINMDDSLLDNKWEMVNFLRLIASEPDIAKIPVMIDSSHWEVLEAGLKSIQGKHIVNSLSLKDGEQEFIRKADIIKKLGAAVVVMAFDEAGQADSCMRKIEICKRAYDILTDIVNFPPEDIIFDPNVLSLGTGMEEHRNYAVDFITAVRWIKQNLPYAKVSGGISNLSFAFRGNDTIREAMHSVFLYHSVNAGLDMGIINPAAILPYEEIPSDLLECVEAVILNTRKDALELLLSYAESNISTHRKQSQGKSWRDECIENRVMESVIRGYTEYLEADLQEALTSAGSAIEIIDKYLLRGMKRVGELFECGKMFLPQVIKSARVMKKAVELLQPYMDISSENTVKTKVLLATVRGDVHDIGKNIVATVLGCNGFEVHDLGIMVDTEEIVDKAIEHKADMVGLSGLITPSLEEMRKVAVAMEKEGLKIPLLIGGAAASAVYTAVKLDKLYSGAVIYIADASKSIEVCKRLADKHQKEGMIEQISREYNDLRAAYNNKAAKFISIEEARKNKARVNFLNTVTEPCFTGSKAVKDLRIVDIKGYIDWTFFFTSLEMRKRYPEILSDSNYGKQAGQLLKEAQNILNELENSEAVQINAIYGVYGAYSLEDDIVVLSDKADNYEVVRLNMLRRQEYSDAGEYPCLSDFIAPKDSGIKDYIGAFAASIKIIEYKLPKSIREDNYCMLIVRLLADRLVEAAAQWINSEVGKDYWGFEAVHGCKGIRPAIGYPSIPDHSEKLKLDKLLGFTDKLDIKLTESFMMVPSSSVCGLILGNPQAHYIDVGKICEDQLKDYASRKNLNIDRIKELISDRIK